jgi:hypothetical protein
MLAEYTGGAADGAAGADCLALDSSNSQRHWPVAGGKVAKDAFGTSTSAGWGTMTVSPLS